MNRILAITVILITISISSFGQQKKTGRRPNILFIIADDAGLDFSAYGSSYVNTPAFDKIAKEGLLFKNAYTPNAKCAPSRSCIMTGRNSWQLEAAANHGIYFPSIFKTYPETLAANGYTTGYTGKGYAPGKALTEDGKPRQLLGKNYDTFKVKTPTRFISTTDYAANFNRFLQTKNEEPWCFWIGFVEPHRPYEYGTGSSLGNKKISSIKRVPKYWPDTDSIRNDMLDYAYELEYMDSQVGKILQALEASGELENTLIVYTSDHGMPFPRVKANHIPLAIMWKNGIKTTGRKIDDYVSFIDLAPTFLQAAEINSQQSLMHPVTGKSLYNIFNSDKTGQVEPSRNFLLVGQERHDIGRPDDAGYPIRGLHKNGMLYLKNYEPERWPACNPETGYLNCDGGATKTFILNQRRSGVEKKYWKLCFGHRVAEELYDVKNDPDCVNNLIADPKYKALAASLKKEMEAKLKAQGDLRMMGYGHLYEKYPQVEANGFYKRYINGEKLKTGWVNETDYETGTIDDY